MISWENAKEHYICGIDVERLDGKRVEIDSEDAGIGLPDLQAFKSRSLAPALIMYPPING
jgi:hypothetical protein